MDAFYIHHVFWYFSLRQTWLAYARFIFDTILRLLPHFWDCLGGWISSQMLGIYCRDRYTTSLGGWMPSHCFD
jgi:hypothetical protein